MKRYEYSDDFFAETRMSFGDHLEELRYYMVRALVGFAVGLVLSFFVGNRIVTFIGKPVEDALVQYYDEREKELVERATDENDEDFKALNKPREMTLTVHPNVLRAVLGQVNPKLMQDVAPPAEDAAPIQIKAHLNNPVQFFKELQPVIRKFGPKLTLKSLSATEAFMVYFKVCLVTGLVIASPWVFYQLWAFVAAGLYPHEKKYVNYYLPFSLFLFLGGVVVTEFVIIPNALNALLSFNKWMNIEPDFRLTEWMSFAIWTPVMAGLCFQTPLVMLFLAKIGVCTVEQYVAKWRIAMFVMVVVAALGPTIDAVTVAILWGCMVGLYALGIALVKWQVKPQSGLIEEEVAYEPGAASTNGQPRETRNE